MSIYEETAINFAKDLEERFGKGYTLEDLLKFQAQEVGLITGKTLSDYSIKNEFKKTLSEQEDKNKKLSRRKICIDIATRHNRSYEGIYALTRDL